MGPRAFLPSSTGLPLVPVPETRSRPLPVPPDGLSPFANGPFTRNPSSLVRSVSSDVCLRLHSTTRQDPLRVTRLPSRRPVSPGTLSRILRRVRDRDFGPRGVCTQTWYLRSRTALVRPSAVCVSGLTATNKINGLQGVLKIQKIKIKSKKSLSLSLCVNDPGDTERRLSFLPGPLLTGPGSHPLRTWGSGERTSLQSYLSLGLDSGAPEPEGLPTPRWSLYPTPDTPGSPQLFTL